MASIAQFATALVSIFFIQWSEFQIYVQAVESMRDRMQNEIDDLTEEVGNLQRHLEEIRQLDPDWHEIQATEADAIGEFPNSIKYHDEQQKLLKGLIARTHEIVAKELK